MKRWHVRVRLKSGRVEEYEVEEISELQSILERGPDWRELLFVIIKYTR